MKISTSGSESEEEDYITLDVLSKEDLTTIVANPRYKTLLIELLNDSDHSADPEDRLSDGNTSNLDTSNGADPATCDEGLVAEILNQGGSTGDDELPPVKRRKEVSLMDKTGEKRQSKL